MQKLVLLFFVISATSYGQDLAELDRRNGFKDIKLGHTVDSVAGIKLLKEFKEKSEYPAKLYSVKHSDYEKIGEVKVSKIELKTYHDRIYEVKVIVSKDPRIMKALESLYGKAEYDLKNDTYFWKTENLILKFQSEGRNKLGLLYISYVLHNSMKEDKGKKIDDIADDF